MKAVAKQHILTGFLVLVLLAFYGAFAYDLQRADFTKLISLYGGLFFVSYTVFKRLRYKFWLLAGIAVLVRLLFLPAIPNLSQDFYRFIWDGRLLAQGINPYLSTVQNYIETGAFPVAQAQELFAGMGTLNAGHFSNYPPLNQVFFAVAGWLFPKSIVGSVIILRLIIILADLGILYFGRKLLKALKLPEYNIFFFILNPFVIIELTGNLHFEGVMLFFLLWGLYVLHNRKWLFSAILIGLSISVKLIPLLLLPVFLKYFRRKNELEVETVIENEAKCQVERSRDPINEKIDSSKPILNQLKQIHFGKLTGFYIVVIVTAVISFLPFLSSEFISNFSATIGLWFQNFEFNASVYYITRWIGFEVVGWNIIGTVGKILPIVVIIGILGISIFRSNFSTKQLLTGLLFAISIYFLLSTTVHPWYVATPLLLSVFTKYKFPLLWSVLVFLSYSAYGETFNENLWFVGVEYVAVIGFVGYEVLINTEKLKSNNGLVDIKS